MRYVTGILWQSAEQLRMSLIDRTYAVGCFCLRQSGTLLLLVFGFSALGAEKPNTGNGSTMLPQAEAAPNAGDRVSPVRYSRSLECTVFSSVGHATKPALATFIKI